MNFFLNKKFIIYGAIILLGAGMGGFMLFNNRGVKEEILIVHPNDFLQQVSVAGRVVAAESVDLFFEQSGRVADVRVNVGDNVNRGQILATQDVAELNAQLAEMQAGIDVQKAKLDQILVGASWEDIQVSETGVANAQISVANAHQAIDDAKQNLVDKIKDAYTKSDDAIRGKIDQLFSNPRSQNPRLNALFLENRSDIERERLSLESMLTVWAESLSTLSIKNDLELATMDAEKNLEKVKLFLEKISLGANTFTQNSDTSQTTIDKWRSDISTARTNINTAISNLSSARGGLKNEEANLRTVEGNLTTAEDQLILKKTPARSSDIAIHEAQIKQAEASTQSIIAQLNKKQIHSPIRGTVTIVNAKAGSIVAINQAAVSLIGMDTSQIESYIPEKNIPFIKIGNQATITLDAYGNIPFMANVISIDPAETIRDGVSTYRTKLQFVNHDNRIKSGMTANVLITTEKKSNVIAVPQGIIISKDGRQFIKIKDGDAVIDRNVETGTISSLGQIEIISGLNDGDAVILEQAEK